MYGQSDTTKLKQIFNYYKEAEKMLIEREIKNSIDTFNRAILLYSELKDTYEKQFSLTLEFAQKLYDVGAIEDAKKYFIDALGYKQYIEIDNADRATCYHYIGTIYSRQGYYYPAIENLQQAISIRENLQQDTLLSHSYNNVGLAYRNIGNHVKSREYITKAFEIRKKLYSFPHKHLIA